MANLHILRDQERSVRPSGGNSPYLLTLLVLCVATTGCWSDIRFDPAAEGQAETASEQSPPTPNAPQDPPEFASSEEPSASAPEVDAEPANVTLPLTGEEPIDLFADVADDTDSEPEPEVEQPMASDTLGHESADTVAASEPEDDDESLEAIFFGTKEERDEPEPEPEPVVAESETPSSSEPIAETTEPSDAGVTDLPWMVNQPETPQAMEEPVEEEPVVEEPAVTVADPMPIESTSAEPDPIAPTDPFELPWQTPDTTAESPEPEPVEVARAESPEPEVTEVDPPQPPDSRQLTWMLASRLSYLLLAPDADTSAIEQELAPVAAALDIELPAITATEPGSADQLKQLLSVGRELGKSAADKYGVEYAALVEIAFKSNLLLAVAETRPQLKHSISGSVAAAAVRAGLPESVWQPFQDQLAESSEPDALADAVVELHSQVGTTLKQSQLADPNSEPPVLR
ncbi:hypothetical protein [Aeoliella sp.]|uniref:hypothetical protein n=1 Tax=Aeoliella sp. TaxID=2795800 RepID=UPI003CCC0DD4